jgi:predicted DCC family thiol-disulfide oxidoreductase YuxK
METAYLFYDRGCGPCTWFARVSASVSRSPLRIESLDSPLADVVLGAMDSARRFDSFHLQDGSHVYSGADAFAPLVGLVGGPVAERTVRGVPPVRHLIQRVYTAFWEYRRARGCAAGERRYAA